MKTKKKTVKKTAKVKPYRFTKEQKMWLKDLETTKTRQMKSRLTRVDPQSGRPIGHCCLGRACIVFRIPFNKSAVDIDHKPCRAYQHQIDGEGRPPATAFLPQSLVKLLKLRDSDGDCEPSSDNAGYRSLASMNDSGAFTFKQIAKFIRKHPRAVFKD